MSTSFINRDQIVDKIAPGTDLTKTKVRAILLALEEQIAWDLKHKSKVKLTDFGTLYLLERKSRTIRQIKSGNKRLLLERTVIKFKSSLKLKARLVGKTLKRRVYGKKPQETEAAQAAVPSEKVVIEPTIEKTVPVKVRLVHRIKLAPLRMMPAVDREKIRDKIKAKLAKLTGLQGTKNPRVDLPTAMDLRQNAAGKVFLNLFLQIKAQDIKTLSFSLGHAPIVAVFGGRPRQQIASLPRKIVEQFLIKSCEIDSYDYPQQRFVKIASSSRMGSKGLLDLHLLPTATGASVNIKIQ